jgi:hypothetical protein
LSLFKKNLGTIQNLIGYEQAGFVPEKPGRGFLGWFKLAGIGMIID